MRGMAMGHHGGVVGVTTLVPNWMARVGSPSAAIQENARGARPSVWRQGWK
jgi:hypothetical protein